MPPLEAAVDQPQDAVTTEQPLSAEEQAAEDAFARGFDSAGNSEATDELVNPDEEGAAPVVAGAEEAASAPAAAAEPAAAAATVVPPVPNVEEIIGRQLASMEHRIRSDIGRKLSDIQKAGELAAQEARNAGGAAPTQTQIDAAASAGGTKWNQLKEDWPDWAAAIEERYPTLPSAVPQTIDVDSIVQQVTARVQQSVPAIDRDLIVQEAATELKHPGWKQTIVTDAFQSWFATQPADFRALGDSQSSADAIKVLDAYDAHASRAQRQNRSTSRLQNAVAPASANAGGPQTIDDEAAFVRGFNRARA